jgi:hypothetical protein
MNKIENKDIEKLLKGAECVLIATDKGIGVVGTGVDVLTYYTALTSNLSKDIPQEMLENAFKRAFKKPSELLDELKGLLEELEKKAGNKDGE